MKNDEEVDELDFTYDGEEYSNLYEPKDLYEQDELENNSAVLEEMESELLENDDEDVSECDSDSEY